MFNKIMELVKTVENNGDAFVRVFKANEKRVIEIHVDIDDFEGFDEEWGECYRELNDEGAVDAFLDFLNENADSVTDDLYKTYHFDGFKVVVGWTSFDI